MTNRQLVMRTNAAGQGIIKDGEGLELKAYPDPNTGGAPWTIGWGSTRGVHEGLEITADQAQTRFQEDVETVEEILQKLVAGITENQFSALVSFCYNVGFGRKASSIDPGKDGFQVLRSGDQSHMLKCLIAGDYESASDEFPKWIGANPITRGGLLKRRLAEQDLFLKPDAPTPQMGNEP